jgi:heptosyltransferase-3
MTPTDMLPPEPRILVIAMRRLGDVLLTTPLVRSLKRGLPGARIDMLVFRGTEGMLAGNPDVDGVRTVATRPTPAETYALIKLLRRKYDLAISTQTGDRPTFLAFVAGRTGAMRCCTPIRSTGFAAGPMKAGGRLRGRSPGVGSR